jgi:hypothetical protein
MNHVQAPVCTVLPFLLRIFTIRTLFQIQIECQAHQQGCGFASHLMLIRIPLCTFMLIRIRLFTGMRIWIRILLPVLIKVMPVCDHWSPDPLLLHFEPPRLHCERP